MVSIWFLRSSRWNWYLYFSDLTLARITLNKSSLWSRWQVSFSLHKKPYSCHNFCYLCSAASRTTLKPKQLMVKPIYNSLWTPRRSAAHSRTEVTCFCLNQGVPFLWNSSTLTSTTLEEWEREETLCRLIQPWNIASLLNALQLQQKMWCVLFGRVRWRYSLVYFNLKDISNIKLFSGSGCLIVFPLRKVAFFKHTRD